MKKLFLSLLSVLCLSGCGLLNEPAEGIPGPQGEQGIQGEQGEQGVQGEKGDKGDTGPQGEQGPQGVQGEVGPAGPQGEQGIQGIQGIQGEKGDKGDQGIQGIQGVQGEKGDDSSLFKSDLSKYEGKKYYYYVGSGKVYKPTDEDLEHVFDVTHDGRYYECMEEDVYEDYGFFEVKDGQLHRYTYQGTYGPGTSYEFALTFSKVETFEKFFNIDGSIFDTNGHLMIFSDDAIVVFDREIYVSEEFIGTYNIPSYSITEYSTHYALLD